MKSRTTGLFTACLTASLLAACSTTPPGREGAGVPAPAPIPRAGGGGYYLDDGPGSGSTIDPMQVPDAVARAEPLNPRANRPYVVFGQSYVPLTELQPFKERGTATWYGRRYHGRRTSNGEPYDMYAMTAAHPRLPLPSYVRVTNLANSRTVIVRVNDRGPFLHGRVIDLSWTAAARLGFVNKGTADVEVELITEFDPQTTPRTAALSTPSTAGATAVPVPGLTLTTLGGPVTPEPTIASVTKDNHGLPPLQREVLMGDEESASNPGPSAVQQSAVQQSAVQQKASPQSPISQVVNPSEKLARLGADNSSTAPGLFLQLGAFQSRTNAEAARTQYLKSLGWTADKLSVRSDGRLHRLLAGPYTDQREASALTERIRATTGIRALPVNR